MGAPSQSTVMLDMVHHVVLAREQALVLGHVWASKQAGDDPGDRQERGGGTRRSVTGYWLV